MSSGSLKPTIQSKMVPQEQEKGEGNSGGKQQQKPFTHSGLKCFKCQGFVHITLYCS